MRTFQRTVCQIHKGKERHARRARKVVFTNDERSGGSCFWVRNDYLLMLIVGLHYD